MVLLDEIIEIAVRAMQHLVAELTSDCPGIGIVSVRRDAVRRCPGDLERFFEERPSSSHVTLVAQATVDKIAVPVDGSVQIPALPVGYSRI